jgi:uncharacterized protein (TIGR03382 family)
MGIRRVILITSFATAFVAGIINTSSAAPCDTTGANLVVDGITCELSGVHTFTAVSVINGGVINVNGYSGGDKNLTGNLELRAGTIVVDATSKIVARGAGYQALICGDGPGPNATAGGRGGCAVSDSGGGGAHFGRGGRGTTDISPPQQFPRDFEEDCGNSVTYDGTGVPTCSDRSGCRNSDGLPSVAGVEFFHSIYQPEFGAAGGDKGCRDGDGQAVNTAGKGGGRIVLAAVNATQTGSIIINGKLDSNGKRGCGDGNDSAGGGAGGTIFVVGDNVAIGASASITAAGGLGGDTQGLAQDPTGECVAPAQQGGTCDDCGGGGGGGIVSVLSINADIADESVFSVNGAVGGTCTICQGEAGGGVGELQISGGYVGEFCDGFDNNFNDQIDEGLGDLNCAGVSQPACVAGIPQSCPADVPACVGPVTDTRARFAVIVDTSGSMLGTLSAVPTFGDGSLGHTGLDIDGNGKFDDSRLFKAKNALTTVISAYPEIDFSLARYHQDTSVDRSCQMAPWFECSAICCSYDNPTNNTGSTVCNVNAGSLGSIPVKQTSLGNEECINYAGNCGPPRRGADILVGFGSDINRYLSWMDDQETSYNSGTTLGNFCPGGDCELRGTGPTPLANSLQAVKDYITPIKACDAAAAGSCRRYGVILLTDGAESCQGDPVAEATALRASGIDTFVVGFSVQANETAQLNAIANAGGTGAAFLVGNEDQLANALASIVSGSIVFETCNNRDDDCDTRIDEDFPQKGNACNDGKLGACLGTGNLVCAANGAGLACNITNPGATPTAEICNGIDDNCNGAIDEGISCTPGCIPTSPTDLCNGIDDDCDGQFEEDDPNIGRACGSNGTAPCQLGTLSCIGGNLVCIGNIEPGVEQCNGLDDDCDGTADDVAQCPGATSCVEGGCRLPCADGEFPCQGGFVCQTSAGGGRFCVPGACANCAANEICSNNQCVDPCAGVTCTAPKSCRFGTCVDCNTTGCPNGQVCNQSQCVADPCAGVDCAAQCQDPQGCSCLQGTCVPNCDDTDCAVGERCAANGTCQPNACINVVCADDEICDGGACVKNQCAGIGCGPGEICQSGNCVDDPCKVVTCSDLFTCKVRDGAALCEPKNPLLPPDRVTAAGGGCSSSGGSSGLAVLMVLAVLLLRRQRPALVAVVLATLATGCNLSPYDLNKPINNGVLDGNNGDGNNGGSDGGRVDAATCTASGPDDTCDEIDNDCNGKVDDAFNKMIDDNNCGACGRRCTANGSVLDCVAGECKFLSCQPGFADLDQDGLTCEYRCPLFPSIAEDCNGVDDDCDGRVDETLPAPPTGQCRITAGTPCAGTTMTCATRAGQTRWFCDYGPDVEFNPNIPNGIVLAEQKCDGKDGDCDAAIDDTFSDLGQECDDGRVGICRDVGRRVCDPADSSQTKCDLSVLPDGQAPGAELCDGKDNDCNGVVDDSSGPNRVIDSMTHVQASGLDYYIDTYEASHPDATVLASGVSTTRACANAGVLPWSGASFIAATAACASAGKVLCNASQWQTACKSSSNNTFPYGNTFGATTCNTESFDGIPGGADDDVVVATGAVTTCRSSDGLFDMSGNLKEWTNEITGTNAAGLNIAVLRGGAYDSPMVGASCDFRATRATVNTVLPTAGFRCCKATAP